jgi:hypothetical protein
VVGLHRRWKYCHGVPQSGLADVCGHNVSSDKNLFSEEKQTFFNSLLELDLRLPRGFKRDAATVEPRTGRSAAIAREAVPPAGFEPAISALKGLRPGPLDDGGFGVGASLNGTGRFI